tara:strand:- start:8360 stop:9355 length:996 start_codon:yes stop_codon:yes gene_type:complete
LLSQIQLALIGFGRIGKIHAENILRMRDVEIAIVIDPLIESDSQLFNNETETGKDIESLLNRSDIDGVVICSPSKYHADQIKTLAPNIKNIFCEKPISLDLEEILSIKELSINDGLNLHIGFNRRYDPDFQKLKNNIHNGAVGDIYQITITSRDPSPPTIEYIKDSGGLFLDMTIHDFDMIRYLTNAEIVEIYAKGKCMIDQNIGSSGDIDTAIINLKLSNGAIASINNSRKAVYGYDQRIEVLGSNGNLQAGNQPLHTINKGTNNGFSSANPKNFFIDRYANSYKIEMQNFINTIRGEKASYSTINDALKTLEVGIAAKKSLTKNKPIQL